MDIISIVISFFAGAITCCIGSVWVFILCAITCLISVVTNNGIFVSQAFGPLLNPCCNFLAGCVAAGYANRRGYNEGNNTLADNFLILGKPDVIIVGGIAAAISWILYVLLGMLGLAGFDACGSSIFLVALAARIIFEGNPFGTESEETKKAGGRFSLNNPVCYFKPWRRLMGKTVIGIAYGGFCAIAMYALVNAGIDPGVAALFGFAFGCTILMFPGIPGNHCVGVTVANALMVVYSTPADYSSVNFFPIVIWGIGIGTLSIYITDFVADAFSNYGKTMVDAVAGSIMFTTLIIAVFVNLLNMKSFVFPIVCFVICTVIGIMRERRWKEAAA